MSVLPVFKFHTKTIQSILDPVAEKVGQLVILHEEAVEGRIIDDLTAPVAAVGAAVSNLIAVGKQTVENTKDAQLKVDMPPTFTMVDNATATLLEASKGLAADAESKPHKAMLLDGARDLLTGVSSLLLVFDQSEVRKIIKQCEVVVEYMKNAEVVQGMEDLVVFTKSLSPGMTSMTRMVDTRTEDLVNPSHKSILTSESEQVKRALPLLLSAMKAFVTLKQNKRKGAAEAQENRNYIVLAMEDSIKEIIRVLQLTSPTEEEGAFPGASSGLPGGLLPGTLAAKIYQAKELLKQTGLDAELNKRGQDAVKEVLKDARRLARSLPAEKRAYIEKLCDEIDALSKELAELQAKGLGDSPRAKELAQLISDKMDELERELRAALARKVAEDFKDPLGPLNALTEAAMAPLDTPNREEKYTKRATDFQHHAKGMADTAAALAKSGGVTDRQLADDLISTANKVKKLAPQVVHASKMLFENPDDEDIKEHYKLVKEDYKRQVEHLTKLVDSGVDKVEFLKASEEQLKADLDAARQIAKTGSKPQEAFTHVASAARTANRVIAVTEGEIENTEDPEFKGSLTSASGGVKTAIAPMVTSAKTAITQSANPQVHETFGVKSDNLVSAVHDVFEVVDKHYNPPPPPPRPPSPEVEAAPPRPPSPEIVEEVPLQSDNPIGYAAHQLAQDAKQWEENEMVKRAKNMAKLMMDMAKYTRGEECDIKSKKDFIMTAKLIAKESEEVARMARKVADACTDKRMKRAILQIVDKIPTIGTQLKIIAAVKATRQGGDDAAADKEASEMLTDNAQNLMSAVSEVLYATEAATIRVPPAEREKLGLQWVKKSR